MQRPLRSVIFALMLVATPMVLSGCHRSATLAGDRPADFGAWSVTLTDDALFQGIPSSIDHGFVYVAGTGRRWLVGDVTVRNNTRKSLVLDSATSRFTLRATDEAGHMIPIDWSQTRYMDGALQLPRTIRPGESATGDVIFSVPDTFSLKSWTLIFEYSPHQQESPEQITFIPLEPASVPS